MTVNDMSDQQPLWTPSQAIIDASNMKRFIGQVNANHGLSIDNYDALYQWSIDQSEAFWSEVWDFCDIIGDKGDRILINGEDIERAQWFPDATLNFAENLLRYRDDRLALVFRGEDRVRRTLTYAQLYDEVARVAKSLRS